MLDHELRTMIDEVKDGRMDRRGFIQRMIALGLTAPMATQILAIGGVAMALAEHGFDPRRAAPRRAPARPARSPRRRQRSVARR